MRPPSSRRWCNDCATGSRLRGAICCISLRQETRVVACYRYSLRPVAACPGDSKSGGRKVVRVRFPPSAYGSVIPKRRAMGDDRLDLRRPGGVRSGAQVGGPSRSGGRCPGRWRKMTPLQVAEGLVAVAVLFTASSPSGFEGRGSPRRQRRMWATRSCRCRSCSGS
jgi:hypothetical protein